MPALGHKRRIRHHVNPMKLDFLRTCPAPLVLSGAVEVELGCADARFLFERARQDPSLRCVGVEIRREMVGEVNRRARAEGLTNLQAVFANINADLADLFQPGQVRRFYVNFPDPWFKRAQHKRRVMTAELGALLCQLLCPGGEVFFQSDVWDLALSAMAVLEQVPGLHNHNGEWRFERGNPYGAQSLREVRVLDKGLPVWRMRYDKRPLAASPEPKGEGRPARDQRSA